MAREAREEDGYEMRVPYVAKRVLKGVRGAQVPSCNELGRKGLWVEGYEERKGFLMLLRDGKGLLMLGMRCAGKGCEAVANSGPNTETEKLLWLLGLI